jgi:hypothetical protein
MILFATSEYQIQSLRGLKSVDDLDNRRRYSPNRGTIKVLN